jgi:hypothetical protein
MVKQTRIGDTVLVNPNTAVVGEKVKDDRKQNTLAPLGV